MLVNFYQKPLGWVFPAREIILQAVSYEVRRADEELRS
jgi:hypothetical protein